MLVSFSAVVRAARGLGAAPAGGSSTPPRSALPGTRSTGPTGTCGGHGPVGHSPGTSQLHPGNSLGLQDADDSNTVFALN